MQPLSRFAAERERVSAEADAKRLRSATILALTLPWTFEVATNGVVG
jgi:hypothetical protein